MPNLVAALVLAGIAVALKCNSAPSETGPANLEEQSIQLIWVMELGEKLSESGRKKRSGYL